MPRLDFWFDFGSTYSYPAAMRIEAEAGKRAVEIVWKPFLLGPIFAKAGLTTSPFEADPVKGAYMWRDLERLCGKYGFPFRRPPEFPQNSVLAERVALVLDPADMPRFSRAVFHREFAEGASIAGEEDVAQILEELGLLAGLIAGAQTPENRPALRQQTEEAARIGIFGAPTFIASDGEMFWGNDRLEDALDWAART